MPQIILNKNEITKNQSNKQRTYHSLEGSFGDYYFFAKTDNSYKIGYANHGVNDGSVYKIDIWIGGHPVGRDSIKGKRFHISNDFICGYWNKWDNKPAKKHKENVNELIKQLEVIANQTTKNVKHLRLISHNKTQLT